MEFRDGWKIYAWHGVPVSERVIETPGTLTRDDVVGEMNPVVRHAIFERLFLYHGGHF